MKTYNTKWLFVAALMMLPMCMEAKTKAREVRANDSAVRYVGRTLTAADGSVSFDWAGTYLETRLKGTSLDILLTQKDTAYYNVFVDNQLHKVLKVYGKDTLMRFVSGLKSGKIHDVRIQKRTEGEYGRTTVHAFLTQANGSLSRVETTPQRHIEFIGNSLTCGFGVEGKSPKEPFLLETENCNRSFATITARYFDADYTLIAHSGRGVVRNYGDPLRVSKATMTDRMLRTFDEDSTIMWDFKAYKPDLVVINLGTNDFSTEPHPYRLEFKEAYTRMLKQLREHYGDVPILCLFCSTITAPVYEYYAETVAAMNDKNIRLLRLPADLFDEKVDYGSVSHPNRIGQRKLAMSIIPTVATMTGWSMPAKAIE